MGIENLPSWLIRKIKGGSSPTEDFIAQMTRLGHGKSSEAIATAMNLYTLSGGSTEVTSHFEKYVSYMTESIEEDPIIPWNTEDLGIFQSFRLWRFHKKIQAESTAKEEVEEARKEKKPDLGEVPDISDYQKAFEKFPTIGAEFHIPQTAETFDNFWQRVAILNMSQYHKESHIPFSKNDQGLIEIRMNPSIYPIATATWNLMRLILPELNKQYFTITINWKDYNFSKEEHLPIILGLQTLGSIRYASFFNMAPSDYDIEGPPFGTWYIGQTEKIKNGKFSLVGSSNSGQGQLN